MTLPPDMQLPENTTALYLDIETSPDPIGILRERGYAPPEWWRSPEEKASAIPGLRRSDAERFAEWMEESGQLDPMRSSVAGIGIGVWIDGKYSPEHRQLLMEKLPGDLVGMLEQILEGYTGPVYGHYTTGFDLPYLFLTAISYAEEFGKPVHKAFPNLTALALAPARHRDTKKAWKNIAGGLRTSSSLDDICRFLDWPTKPGSGKDWHTYDDERKRAYLTHDVDIGAKFAELMFCGDFEKAEPAPEAEQSPPPPPTHVSLEIPYGESRSMALALMMERALVQGAKVLSGGQGFSPEQMQAALVAFRQTSGALTAHHSAPPRPARVEQVEEQLAG